jgi:hypothetical protein
MIAVVILLNEAIFINHGRTIVAQLLDSVLFVRPTFSRVMAAVCGFGLPQLKLTAILK